MQVAHPSTAANYFHLLRMHMHLPYRKPLIVVAPKKLLRYKGATSDIEEFAEGTRYQFLIKDQNKSLVAQRRLERSSSVQDKSIMILRKQERRISKMILPWFVWRTFVHSHSKNQSLRCKNTRTQRLFGLKRNQRMLARSLMSIPD